MGHLRRVLGIGLAWAVTWTAFWALVGLLIGVVDPDSIDPGEGWLMFAVFVPMGLLSGVVFGVFMAIEGRVRPKSDPSAGRVAGWGTLATGLVQLAYLGHGDQGLAANIGMALLFCAFGGAVTLTWFAMARKWSRGRSSRF